MKGFVFQGPGQFSWDTVPDPGIKDATDVIVRVDAVTICGTDLHILQGDVPEVRFSTILGHLIDGTQAEYVRVPHADSSVHPLPSTLEAKDAVLRAEIFPTGYEVGVLNGQVRPEDTVAVVGAGPVGLAAIATARLDPAKRFGADAVADTRDTEEAYDVFVKAADTGALKVVLGGTRYEEVAVPAAGREDVTRHA
ncbi:alcohol dehydrogenase catalytic domain-containing protein [Streptomyces sp. SAS_260]